MSKRSKICAIIILSCLCLSFLIIMIQNKGNQVGVTSYNEESTDNNVVEKPKEENDNKESIINEHETTEEESSSIREERITSTKEEKITLNGKEHTIKMDFVKKVNQYEMNTSVYMDNELVFNDEYFGWDEDVDLNIIKGKDNKDYLLFKESAYADGINSINSYYILSDNKKVLAKLNYAEHHVLLKLDGKNSDNYLTREDTGFDKAYYPISISNDEIKYFLTDENEISIKYYEEYYEGIYEINSKEYILTINDNKIDISLTGETYYGTAGISGSSEMGVVHTKIY